MNNTFLNQMQLVTSGYILVHLVLRDEVKTLHEYSKSSKSFCNVWIQVHILNGPN